VNVVEYADRTWEEASVAWSSLNQVSMISLFDVNKATYYGGQIARSSTVDLWRSANHVSRAGSDIEKLIGHCQNGQPGLPSLSELHHFD
jgi:hypothetical protein